MKKKIVFLLCCCLFITTTICASDNKLLDLIVEDINLSIKLYRDQSALFPDNPEELYNHVKLIGVDTIWVAGEYRSSSSLRYLKGRNEYMGWEKPTNRLEFASYDLYSIKIAIDVRWYANRKGHPNMSLEGYDTLNYLVMGAHGEYYKIFGFSSTDIKSAIVGEDQFKGFVTLIKEKGILSAKQAKFYMRSVINNDPVIPWQVNRPCEYFRYQYLMKPEDLQCSIILKSEPLIPPRAQIIKYVE